MSKTFAKNSVINENFAEVPNLSVYYKSRADMSRSYQVNSAFAQSVSNSTASVRNTIPSNSTAQLFDDEEEVSLWAIAVSHCLCSWLHFVQHITKFCVGFVYSGVWLALIKFGVNFIPVYVEWISLNVEVEL